MEFVETKECYFFSGCMLERCEDDTKDGGKDDAKMAPLQTTGPLGASRTQDYYAARRKGK
jgi:hypothetical protein